MQSGFFKRHSANLRVGEHFELILGGPSLSQNDEFAHHVPVIDLSSQNRQKFIAILFSAPEICRLSSTLYKTHIHNYLNLIETGIVVISGKEHLCVIIEKPPAGYIPLSDLTEELAPSVLMKLVLSLVETIASLHEVGVMHGVINYNTIYLNPDGFTFFLDNCLSAACGALQVSLFETLDRSRVHKYGKGNEDFLADYYAIGVAILWAMSKERSTTNHDAFTVALDKSKKGDYWYLLGILELDSLDSEYLSLAYLAHQLIVKKWSTSEVRDWSTSGYKTEVLTENTEKCAEIYFKGQEYRSIKSLAVALSYHWQEGRSFIRQEQFISWLTQLNSISNATIAKFHTLYTQALFHSDDYYDIGRRDMYLSQVLLLLDPDGPLFLDRVGFYRSGVSSLLGYCIVVGDNHTAHRVLQCLYSMQFYTSNDSQKRLDRPYVLLYKLDPLMPIQNAFTDNRICFSVEEFCTTFDMLRFEILDQSLPQQLLDFISVRLGEEEGPEVKLIPNIEYLRHYNYFKLLEFMSLAQEKLCLISLVRSCNIFVTALQGYMLDAIQGKSIKEHIRTEFAKAAATGTLSKVLSVFSLEELHCNLQNYSAASEKAKALRKEIILYDAVIRNEDSALNRIKTVLFRGACCAFLLSLFWMLYQISEPFIG